MAPWEMWIDSVAQRSAEIDVPQGNFRAGHQRLVSSTSPVSELRPQACWKASAPGLSREESYAFLIDAGRRLGCDARRV